MTKEEWEAEGKRRFGPDRMKWKFRCPVCKRTTSVQEWKDAGASEGEIGFSCVGRHRDDVECDYAGGGLFRLNPVAVEHEGNTFHFFDFAEENDDLRGTVEVDRACS